MDVDVDDVYRLGGEKDGRRGGGWKKRCATRFCVTSAYFHYLTRCITGTWYCGDCVVNDGPGVLVITH